MEKSYMSAFDPENRSSAVCKNCGLCLQKCPVMKMEKNEALEEHARLRSGEEPLRVLNECTFCFNCNSYCPNDMTPFALIMERQYEKIRAGGGVPSFLRYLFTGEGETSVFEDMYAALTDVNREILDRWETPPLPSKDVLFIGCTGREIPDVIENSKVLSTLPKYGPRTACCGELPFRLGDFEEFKVNADRTMEMMKKIDAERVVFYCGSCTHTFRNVWSKYLDMELPFEMISIWEWLWEKVQSGELKAVKKVSGRIAIADSCYSSELGDGFYEAVRGLHEEAGYEIVELKNNRYDTLCCGTVSVIRNNFDFMQSFAVAGARVRQFAEAGVKEVSCYCPGCLGRLNTQSKNIGIDTVYSLEKILGAFGDDETEPLINMLAKQNNLVIEKLKKSMAGK